MDHVASVPSAASSRMSPEAMGLAMLLHAVAAIAFWWLAAHRPPIAIPEQAIEIVIEQPKTEPPPPPPPQVQRQQPISPPVEGLRPPAETTADKPTQVRPSGEAPKDIASQPPRSLDDAVPKPPEPPAAPTEQAMAAPPPPAPAPPPERPRVEPFFKPTPGPTVEPFTPAPGPTVEPPPPPRPSPPSQPPVQAHPQPQPQPQARPAPPPSSLAPHNQPQPSPLVGPSHQPPAVARHQDTPTPPASPFVNPADEKNRSTAEQNYLWEVVRKLRGYRYHANVPMDEGLTVVVVVIARDGRLVSAQVVRSSGVPAMDDGVLAGVRQGSPYTPLPPEIQGPSATFRLPLVSVHER
jgi:protein TonB